MGNSPLELPLIYRVYYNGTTKDVDNVTTYLIFPFPPLSVGIFRDDIHLIVTAVNRFGSGVSSTAATATVCKLTVINHFLIKYVSMVSCIHVV